MMSGTSTRIGGGNTKSIDATGHVKNSKPGGNASLGVSNSIQELEDELGFEAPEIIDNVEGDDRIQPNNVNTANTGDVSKSVSTAQTENDEEKHSDKDIEYILNEIKELREKVDNKKDKSEDDEIEGYPQDCYTIIALNGPMEKSTKWSKEQMVYFGCGLMVFTLQFCFLVLTIMSRVDPSIGDVETDNPGTDEDDWKYNFGRLMVTFVDANQGYVLLTSQFLSLFVYVLFPDSSLEDVVLAIQYFPKFWEAEDGDPVRSMGISCVLRGSQGILASIAVFLVVVTSDTVLDIVLNFTALNFISNLDDHFFSLAQAGVFGPGLKKETQRIEKMELPSCMARKCPHFCYRIVMIGFALIFLPLLIFVTSCQASPNMWLTHHLRVEYPEKEYRAYSGCYNLTDDRTKWSKRYTYSSYGGQKSTSIGYCAQENIWVVVQDDPSFDPCDAKESGDGLVAYSAETTAYDVSSSFGIPWWDYSGSPLDIFFVTDELETHCDLRILDGKCDPEFNEPGFLYDSGDCCAATCVGSECGLGQLKSVFGNSNATGDGFPTCEDPDMVSVTIHINDLKSSREDIDTSAWLFLSSESEWRNVTPPPLYYSIECNDKPVLTVYIEESMINKSETIKVEDGSSCRIVVKNETDTIDLEETWLVDTFGHYKGSDSISPDPTWYVNYTVFFELDQRVEVLSANSQEEGLLDFTLFPKCFFEELKNEIDTSNFYNSKGLEWLARDNTEILRCGEKAFLERFALLQIDFGFNESAVEFANRETQCSWRSVHCSGGIVDSISLQGEGLNGDIASELGLLTGLKKLDVSYNNIESFPSELALLTNLRELQADRVHLDEIPVEIGHLTELTGLSWHFNEVKELPPEIFRLTNLVWSSFYINQITELPSEIGLLTDMLLLSFFGNDIYNLPFEFFQLTNMGYLDMFNNSITEISSQIGLMTNLGYLDLGHNPIREIPSEIGSLTKLTTFLMFGMELAEIPSQIGLLTKLAALSTSSNQLTQFPSEIGLLTELRHLSSPTNKITEIPSQIGLLTNLTEFWLRDNQLTMIPPEMELLTKLTSLDVSNNSLPIISPVIGNLEEMKDLRLSMNQLTGLPSEIGNLAKLSSVFLDENQLTSIPSDIGRLEAIEVIVLGNNQLTGLPSEIMNLTNLWFLSLDGNQFSRLPSEIELLTNLKNLKLGNNTFIELPPEIWRMTNLTNFHLNNMLLTHLPPEVGRLTNLKHLDLENNFLPNLPSEIGLLTNLEYLNLGNNLLADLPSEIGLLTNITELDIAGHGFTCNETILADGVDCIDGFNHTESP